jgi:hypothetical protein
MLDFDGENLDDYSTWYSARLGQVLQHQPCIWGFTDECFHAHCGGYSSSLSLMVVVVAKPR